MVPQVKAPLAVGTKSSSEFEHFIRHYQCLIELIALIVFTYK